MKHKQIKWNLSGFVRAFLILALLFLAIGLGTLGSAQSVGGSYRLSKQRDAELPSIIVHLTEPGHGEEGHVHRTLYVKQVYLNVGTVYAPYGEGTVVRLAKGSSGEASFYYNFDLNVVNLTETVKEDEKDENSQTVVKEGNILFNWYSFDIGENGWALSNNAYWRLTTLSHDVLINEIVFVANEADGSGVPVVLNAEIDSNSNLQKGQDATPIIDKQKIPSLSQSSFTCFGREEVATLSTIAEMRQGATYGVGNVNHMDTVYNSLGLDLVSIGTYIFGISPFGLRFMPFLASFGVLIFGFLFVRRLFSSDKAGFAFALLYSLCGVSLSLGHLGTPLMIGVFFFTASLYFCFRFYQDGMKKASYGSAVPAMLSGLFAAAAICTNGAYLIPVLGIVALFAAGAVRHHKAQRAELDLAIEEAEREEEQLSASEENVPHAAKEKAVKLNNEIRFKSSVSASVFGAFLVFGCFLLSMLAALPLYNVFIKVYDNPAQPSESIFTFLGKAFAGGYIGNNGIYRLPSAWSFFYQLFRGTGNVFAVTAAGSLIAVAPILAGLAGAVFAIVTLARKKGSENLFEIVLPFAGFALCVLTSFFAKGGLGFVFLSYLFLFVLAAFAAQSEGETKKGKIVFWVFIALTAVCFLLFAVFTFSIPLPASFMNALVG